MVEEGFLRVFEMCIVNALCIVFQKKMLFRKKEKSKNVPTSAYS